MLERCTWKLFTITLKTMKNKKQIEKKLDEFREERFKKDVDFKHAVEIGELEESSVFFEKVVTLEGSIKALKWVLNHEIR